jgi:hypothetical protein
MKSKDQQLLEEAYGKVRLNNYGMPNVKSKGKPLSPYDDSARLAAKREEQNAGLKDDVETFREPYTPHASQTPKVEIDASKFQGKTIDYRMNQYDGFEIVIDGKKVGADDLSSSQAKYIIDLLKDVEKNKDNSVLQNWYKSAVKDLQ